MGGSRVEGVGGSYREEWAPAADDPSAHRWQLVYLGAGGGVLKFSARECIGATVPLQNEMSSDLQVGGTTFRYRGVEMEVLSADNSGLTYRVSAEK